MAEFATLRDAIAATVHDGQTLALEGFTHLIPFAAGHEIIRQGRRHLHVIRMTPDLIYDQMIGAGCVDRITFSWGGNPGVGSLHRFRDAVEHGWPNQLELDERSHAAMANAWAAGASGLPFAVFKGYLGTSLPGVNQNVKTVACPFTGETLAAVPALNPDVGIVHAQRADRKGNVLIEGIIGAQKETILASSVAVVTVEEIVDDLAVSSLNSIVMPHWTIDLVAEVPNGARPSYAHGYYQRDNAYYKAWDGISREREAFADWLDREVMTAT